MSNTTQETLLETFMAIAGTGPSSLNPFIDAGAVLASAAGDIARVIGSTAKLGAVTAGPESVGRPIADLMPDPAGSFAAGPAPVPAPSSMMGNPIQAAMPAGSKQTTTTPAAAPSSGGTVGSTVESVASTVMQNVFGTIPLLGALEGAHSGGSGGIGGTIESIASTVLKSGLGMVPLIGDLLGLFGGGGNASTPPPLVKYAMPASIGFEGADTPSGVGLFDYDQMGKPRSYGGPSAGGNGSSTAPPAQITVNVQAMDARSFLDRSGDIAAAVREAMLNSNSINDVVNEL